MDDLIKYGKIRRAVVGVRSSEVTPTDARAAGLTQIGGAKVEWLQSRDEQPGGEGRHRDRRHHRRGRRQAGRPGEHAAAHHPRLQAGRRRRPRRHALRPEEDVQGEARRARRRRDDGRRQRRRSRPAPRATRRPGERTTSSASRSARCPRRSCVRPTLPLPYRNGLMVTKVSPRGPRGGSCRRATSSSPSSSRRNGTSRRPTICSRPLLR